MPIPVVLFAPNILGYVRILTAFLGLHVATTSKKPMLAVCIWVFSASLDLVDGYLARTYDQCSSFGVLLDIAADNTLRTSIWIAAASQDSSYCTIAGLIIVLEWCTMLCTQLHATQSGKHWKETRDNDPRLIQYVLASNFKSPLGVLCVYGLFSAGIFAFGAHHSSIVQRIPWFTFWKNVAYVGRALSAIIEMWFCKGYLSMVLANDMQLQRKKRVS